MTRPRPSYVALIGDLVDSRSLAPKQREELQSDLHVWLEDLNRAQGPEGLAAPLTLTAGDEIQGLFRKPSGLVTVIQVLTDRMFQLDGQPTALFGLGRGPISTGRIPALSQAKSPALLDGPAFHNARAALEHAQDVGGWVRFVGFDPPDFVVDHVLDALFALMGTIRERWTANQGRLSYLMRGTVDPSPPSQSDLARRLKVSPSVVSETLKASRHLQLVEGEEAARALLATLERDPR